MPTGVGYWGRPMEAGKTPGCPQRGSVVRRRQCRRRPGLDTVDGHGEGVVGDAGDADDLRSVVSVIRRPPTDSETVLCAGQKSSGTHCTTSLPSH